MEVFDNVWPFPFYFYVFLILVCRVMRKGRGIICKGGISAASEV